MITVSKLTGINKMRLFKVFTATDGVHTMYCILKRTIERSANHYLSGCFDITEEILEFSDEDIVALNKYHCLKVKTGYDSNDIVNAFKSLIREMNDEALNYALSGVDEESKTIIFEQIGVDQ